jgi:hypothetical protein
MKVLYIHKYSQPPVYWGIYGGAFHITIEKNYLDEKVKILTGVVPSKQDIETGSGSTPTEILPEEESCEDRGYLENG